MTDETQAWACEAVHPGKKHSGAWVTYPDDTRLPPVYTTLANVCARVAAALDAAWAQGDADTLRFFGASKDADGTITINMPKYHAAHTGHDINCCERGEAIRREARAECARVVAGALGCVDYASGWSHGFYCNAGGADGHSCTRVAAAIDALRDAAGTQQ